MKASASSIEFVIEMYHASCLCSIQVSLQERDGILRSEQENNFPEGSKEFTTRQSATIHCILQGMYPYIE